MKEVEKNIYKGVTLINKYMRRNAYLKIDQRKSDNIRNSLSWRITYPIRFIKKYNYIIKSKKSYCVGFKEWKSEFPQFNKSDIRIFSDFRDDFSLKISILLILEQFKENEFYRLLLSIHNQKLKINDIFIASKNLRNNQIAEMIRMGKEFGINVNFDNIYEYKTDYIYVAYSNSCFDENAFSVHIMSCNVDTIISYSDDEYIFPNGRVEPAFKPNFSPKLLESIDYFKGGFFVHDVYLFKKYILIHIYKDLDIRKAILIASSLIPESNFFHIPFILNKVYMGNEKCLKKINHEIVTKNRNFTISIIIPTKNNIKYLKKCIKSILYKTIYKKELIEIIIINNGEKTESFSDLLEETKKLISVLVINYYDNFNYSLMNNLGVSASSGEIIIFLNDDTKLLDRFWIHRILSILDDKNVGIVGSKLLYGNRRVQHNGCIIGGQTFARHAGLGLTDNDPGYLGLMSATREITAVTGACMAIRRSLFIKIKGFDENLKVAFNDILLCLQSISLGYKNVLISTPLFVHYESISRGLDLTSNKINIYRKELDYIKNKIGYKFLSDPFYNDNLSISNLYQLSFPPRRKKIWRNTKYNYNKNIVIIYEDIYIMNNLLEIFSDKFNINGFFVDPETDINDSLINEICKYVFINDADYIIISSYNFEFIPDIFGDFCRIFFSYDLYTDIKKLFFDIYGIIYEFNGNDFSLFSIPSTTVGRIEEPLIDVLGR